MIKHEWKKLEKHIYLPKAKPELIEVPKYQFFTIAGAGNPNSECFAKDIQVLYSLAYGIRMMPKKGITPEGYFEYVVYPLEGVWDLSEQGRQLGYLDKNELVYKIMIRQPSFVTTELANEVITNVKKKQGDNERYDQVKFEMVEEGLSLQMMHIGPYDDEPQSFALMKEYCEQNNLIRTDLRHREIYISDFRKTAPEKLRTVLRFPVKQIK